MHHRLPPPGAMLHNPRGPLPQDHWHSAHPESVPFRHPPSHPYPPTTATYPVGPGSSLTSAPRAYLPISPHTQSPSSSRLRHYADPRTEGTIHRVEHLQREYTHDPHWPHPLSHFPTQPVTSHRWPPLTPHQPQIQSHAVEPADFGYDTRKKRLRNSRSCAECQRRKTRCDAEGRPANNPTSSSSNDIDNTGGDNHAEGDMIVVKPCTNCQRSGVECQFSRRPAKRGPSKGYIKDLETRLNDLQSFNPKQSPDSDQDHRQSQQDHKPLHTHRASSTASDAPSDSFEHGRPNVKKRPMRPWEFEPSPEQEKIAEARRSSPPAEAVSHAGEREEDCVDVAQAMVSLGNKPIDGIKVDAVDQASVIPTPPASHPVKSEDDKDSVPLRSLDKASIPQAVVHRQQFARSNINGTFGLRRFDGANDAFAVDDPLLQRALRLLTEAAGPTQSASESVSRMTTPASVSGMDFANPGKRVQKSHNARLGQLQGRCMSGMGFNWADGLLLSSNSNMSAIGTAREIRARVSALEGEALVLCYLDSIRHGNPDNSALAAACSKLTSSSGSGGHSDPEPLRRHSAVFAMDRWHSASFNTPHAFAGPALPSEERICRQIEAFSAQHDGPLDTAPAEVLRAALMFDLLRDLADACGGYRNLSMSQCQSIIYSTGPPEGSRQPSTSSGGPSVGGSQAPVSSGSASSQDERQREGTDEPNLYSVEALREMLKSSFVLFFCLQTLPEASKLNIKSLGAILRTLERSIFLGDGMIPLDPETLVMQSFIGPFVFALAATAVSWLGRAIALVSKQTRQASLSASESQDNAASKDLNTLGHLCKKLRDYARMMGSQSVFAAGRGQKVQPLWLRVAAYNNTNVSYLSRLQDIAWAQEDASRASAESHSPLEDTLDTLRGEVDGRAALIQEMGPMGLVLVSTTAHEAWALLPDQ